MNNEVVVFSGFRSDDLKKQVEEKGGKVAASLVKATTTLVVGPKGKVGAKVEEAIKRGIAVMTLEAFTAKLHKPVKPKSTKTERRETLEMLEYRDLVELEKGAQERGSMRKRKGVKMTKAAVIARLLAKEERDRQ